ncbi:hypothetical protein B5M44_11615 [Shinella sumterensis]|jgi:hypothetical protein|uniref:hypothetical protein n=1 Tax=Shinella sumterensis TaxID=1967501 RepID=UPI00106EDC9D|nr:hypothetical protein [Shinella sumterensis]MCD1265535.1 hypothetical protein [Shinella sumterensis]TFE98257.1 hypothetical protein B5M44_11615 [Shinella sumterensis]
MTKKRTWEELWPTSHSKIGRSELQDLDDEEFRELRRLTFQREVRRTKNTSRAKKISRKLNLKRRFQPRVRFSKEALRARFQPCEILESFVPDRKSRWRKLLQRKKGGEICCKNFSFIDYPKETSEILQKIALAECEAVAYRINFDDRYVSDVGPFLLLGVMREKMAPLTSGGRLSASTAKVLEAAGLNHFLSMASIGKKVPKHDVWPLPIRQRRRAGSSKNKSHLQPATYEIAADQIVAKVHDWLGTLDPPQGLTQFGAGKIKSMIGEVLNNAERHSRIGGDGEWITAGFMARRLVKIGDNPRTLHICHLSLLNPGRPISETIKEAPSEIVEQVAKYQALHRKSGVSEETLATVFALQDGISRVLQGEGMPSGGTGMMDVVEFANEVGKAPTSELGPKVAIISGKAYIRFSGDFNRGIMPQGSERRLQWFNVANDVKYPPHPGHVMDLPYTFPGTLITLRFALGEQLGEEDG